LSFEIVFDWKLSLTRLLGLISLTHRTTKLAQEQNLLAPGSWPWIFSYPVCEIFLACPHIIGACKGHAQSVLLGGQGDLHFRSPPFAFPGSLLNRFIAILFQINNVVHIIYFNPTLAASSGTMDLKLLHPTWPKLSTSSVHALQWHDSTKLLISDFKLKQKVCHNYFNKIHSYVNPFILAVQDGKATCG